MCNIPYRTHNICLSTINASSRCRLYRNLKEDFEFFTQKNTKKECHERPNIRKFNRLLTNDYK